MADPRFIVEEFSLRLQCAAADLGTLAQVAAACGLPKPTLESYLYQGAAPRAGQIALLCKGLGVSADWLLFGEGQA